MATEPVSFNSPYYPYRKVLSGANTLRGAELIPYKIINYLLDMPDSVGYVPADDNSRPRVRLMKYLYYDGANPLTNPLPTPKQKQSILFNPDNPDINTDEDKKNHPKGYRIFAQRNVAQSLIDAQTILKIYVGRVLDPDIFKTVIGLQAEIWANPNLVANTKTTAYDRLFDIEQCLREALSGVDIAGVGTLVFSRNDGSFNGSENLYGNGGECGRIVYFSTAWSESGEHTIKEY